jgi:hypothetical protein
MSDMKPRRAPRDIAPVETNPTGKTGEAVTGEPVPIIAPQVAGVSDSPDPIAAAIAEVVHAPPGDAAAPAVEMAAAAADDSWTAVADVQAALSRGFEQFAVEIVGLGRTGMVAAADTALALLTARTFAEAVEINAGLARRGVDSMTEGTAKLSEIGLKTIAEASRPVLARLGSAWEKAV